MKNNITSRLVTVAVMALVASQAGAQNQAQLASQTPRRGLLELKKVPSEKRFAPQVVKELKKARKAEGSKSPFFGRTFYGSLINSNDWANTSITKVPYGIYNFEVSDDMNPQANITNLSYNFQSGAYTGNQFFGISAMAVLGGLNGARYITIDTENWKETKNVMYDATHGSYSLLPSVMAYNYIDNSIYSFQYKEDLSGLDWCKYNTQYDAMDKIGTFRGKYNVLALATVPSGDMYFINGYGDLYKINKANGRPTLVEWTGVSPTLYSQSMTYDNRTGLFLWAALSDDGNCLYSVDPVTAETKLITKFKKNEQFTAIYSLDEGAKDGAPAKANNLKLTYDSDGALSGNINFDVPTTTFDGKSLGKVKLNVWLDGTNLKGVEAQAGEKVAIPVNLEEGNHYVAVNMENENGWSPLASLKQYAGYDIPLAVTDVAFKHEDNSNVVTWTAPTAGVNKGYVDANNMKYTVVRMPDSVTVAKDLAATSFTETTPSAMHSYSYRVIANNKDKSSAYVESNKILCGDAFTAPYSQSFADASVLSDYFTVIDNNNDNNTWRAGYQGDVRIDINANTAPTGDDWLVTPAISLEGGTTYRYTVNLKTFMKGYPEDFELLVGTNPKDVSTFKSIKKEENAEIYESFTDYPANFQVESDGKYYLALRYLGDTNKKSSMLMVKKMSVTKLAKSKAPEKVSQLTVTPGKNDAMMATISFTTPSKNLDGEELDKLSKVNVYRNGNTSPIHTFEAPAPNTTLTWTDNHVEKMGVNSYTVKAENENGEGEAIADSAFIGCYTAPYLETFSTRAAAEQYTTYMEGIDLEKNDSYQWKYSEYAKDMTIYALNADADNKLSAWLITPLIKLDANAVYTLSYKKNFSVYKNTVSGHVYMGKGTKIEDQATCVGDMEPNAGYGMEDGSNMVITTDAGKYCFGFNITATAQFDNIMADLDDISLVYQKSALSPYQISNFKAVADAKGELKAYFSFKAPVTDYHGNRLSDNMTINIYRGNGSIPVYTQEDVIPGATIHWTDEQAQNGNNKYVVVASNKYGSSEILTHNLYVGIDRPAQVNNLTIKGSDDNCTAVINWDAPENGHNGGVILKDDLTYRILQYDASDNSLSIVADNVKEHTYSIAKANTKKQEYVYYGVVAKNDAGIGDTIITSCLIGKLYELPYKESFSNKEAASTPWVISSENTDYQSWGVANPDGSAYNAATPQDADGGCAYYYNGSYYESYAGAGFISPKVGLNGKDNTLSFWAYNYPAKYSKDPYLVVYARVDDGQYVEIARYDLSTKDGEEEGWKNYAVDLSGYKNNHYVNFAFFGYTAGYQECIYLDNISIGDVATSILNAKVDGKDVDRICWHDANGRAIAAPGKGINIQTIYFTDGSKKSVKVVR